MRRRRVAAAPSRTSTSSTSSSARGFRSRSPTRSRRRAAASAPERDVRSVYDARWSPPATSWITRRTSPRSKGSAQPRHSGLLEERLDLRAQDVAGHEHEAPAEVRKPALERAIEPGTVEVRHPHVAEDQIVRRPPELLERLCPIRHRVDRVVIGAEHLAEQLDHQALVVDDEDALALHDRRRVRRALPGGHRGATTGSSTRKIAPCPASLTSDSVPPCTFDDPVAERETETRSPARPGFVVKNGSKMRSRISAEIPGRCPRRRARRAAHRVGPRAQGQPARLRRLAQLVAGIGDQVHHDLVELMRVGPQHRESRRSDRARPRCGRRAGDTRAVSAASRAMSFKRTSCRAPADGAAQAPGSCARSSAQRSAACAMASARVADGVARQLLTEQVRVAGHGGQRIVPARAATPARTVPIVASFSVWYSASR